MRGKVDLSERALAYQATDGVVANSTELVAAEFAVVSCEPCLFLAINYPGRIKGISLEELAIRVCEFSLLAVELVLGSRGGWHTHTIDVVCACLSRNTPIECLSAVLCLQSFQTSDSLLFLPSCLRVPVIIDNKCWPGVAGCNGRRLG